MSADRFFTHVALKKDISVLLEGAEHHHLTRVMRVVIGDEVQLVNGRGDLANGKVVEVSRRSVLVQVVSVRHENDLHPSFSLAIPMMRASKLEWVIEKGTELGASSFFCYLGDLSEKEGLSAHQMERLQHLSISALKQSDRLYLPSIKYISALSSLPTREAQLLFGDRKAAPLLAAWTSNVEPMILVTGPEKGFSPSELSFLHEHAKGVSLSPHILRAETAPIAAASILAQLVSSKKSYVACL